MRRSLIVLACAILSMVGRMAVADDPLAIDLVYEIDAKTSVEPVALNDLLTSVSQRVAPWGFVDKRRETLRVRVSDPKHVHATERALAGDGGFELRMLANSSDDAALIATARERDDAIVKDSSGKTLARWIAIDPRVAGDKEALSAWTTRVGQSLAVEALAIEDAHNVTGEIFASAVAGRRPDGGSCIVYQVKPGEVDRWRRLVRETLPNPASGHRRQLAMIVGGYLRAVPLPDGAKGEEFTVPCALSPEETEAMAAEIRAAMKPLPIKFLRSEVAKPAGFRRRRAPPPPLSRSAALLRR